MASSSALSLVCRCCCQTCSEPVVLSCSHCFCRLCLDTLWTDNPIRKCPHCGRRSSLKWIPPSMASESPPAQSQSLCKDHGEEPEQVQQNLQELQEMHLKEEHLSTTETEKCYNPSDPTLKFVEGEDDHDFLCVGFKSRRALMSCGHSVTPMSLTEWCELQQLNKGKTKFECAMCKAVWSFEEVCKMALLTKKEKNSFEKKLFKNVAINKLKAKFCPGCKSFVIRDDFNSLCVQCPQCTADKGRNYKFCWQCLREWKGPALRSDHCDNVGCTNKALETLRTCSVMQFKDVSSVTGCPQFRACPICGLLVEHNCKHSKNVLCPECKVEFCFVCLKTTKECLKTSSYFIPCSDGVAPRQTLIPFRRL